MFTPRTTIEASRLIRCTEAAAKLEAGLFWNGDGTCTLDSWKTDENGKRIKSRYEVDLNKGTCTCPDFEGHLTFCKHLIYAEAVSREEEIEAGQESLLAQMTADAENAEVYPW